MTGKQATGSIEMRTRRVPDREDANTGASFIPGVVTGSDTTWGWDSTMGSVQSMEQGDARGSEPNAMGTAAERDAAHLSKEEEWVALDKGQGECLSLKNMCASSTHPECLNGTHVACCFLLLRHRTAKRG